MLADNSSTGKGQIDAALGIAQGNRVLDSVPTSNLGSCHPELAEGSKVPPDDAVRATENAVRPAIWMLRLRSA